jgi:hypothetical protein
LYFGAWNFHDLLKSQLLYLFQAITCLNDVALQLEVKWLKGIYIIDKTIKGFESQEKSVSR